MTASEQSVVVSVSVEALAGATVKVRHFEIDERLSVPYRAVIDIETDAKDAKLDELRGTNVRLVLARPNSERALCGVIWEVEEGRGGAGNVLARLIVQPAFAHLSLVRNTRIFQEKDVPTIVEEVLTSGLSAYGRELKKTLDGTYATREYCVQYQETDLAFVHRLLEEEGIAYSFDHEGETELLVLTDHNAAFARAAGAAEALELTTHDLVIEDREPIHRFTRRHAATTTSVALRDFDWTSASYVVEAEQRSADGQGRDRESYEHGWGRSATIGSYDAGARRYQEQDAAHRAGVRQESYLAGALIGRGMGRVIGLAPGTSFELHGHPGLGIDGEYLVTAVHHRSVPADVGGGASAADLERYHNVFECIPLGVRFRPARSTPKPRIPSIQTALVTGPSGEEIHTDEHGRIKVLFTWDREGAADETSSCWVRVQQKWAGAGWGFWWLPRIGMEVVVEFIDGDPDRPLVTGSVYNATNGTPYPLPDEKTKSTIKSNSSPGGGGFNELRFEDKAGSEEIFTHAQKDYNEVVENDHNTLVHGNQTIEVDNDQTQTIHGDQEERVDGNQDMSVGGDRSVHAEAKFDETVDGTETRKVTGAVSETFSASETRSVSGNLDEMLGAGETRTIGAAQSESIGGSLTRTVAAASDVTVGGAGSQSVDGGITVDTPAAWTLTATGGLNITAAGGFKLNAPGGLRIGAPGGVTQIDTHDNLLASTVFADGGSIRAVTGFKNEWIGTHVSLVGGTFGVGVFHVMIGLVVEAKAAEDSTAAVDNTNGAVGATASGGKSK